MNQKLSLDTGCQNESELTDCDRAEYLEEKLLGKKSSQNIKGK